MKFKNLFLTIGLVSATLSSLSAYADYRDELMANGLPIINSIDEKDVLPGGFRMTKVITLPKEGMPTVEGLDQLNMSGSSQFTEHSLDALIKRIGKKHITIVNLRQEDGGFLEPVEGKGAIAFSYLMPMPWWTGEDPRGNRTVAEIEASEEKRMQDITQQKSYTVFGSSDSYAPTDTHKLLYRIDMAVKRAFTEKQLVGEKGLGYFRIPDKKFGNMEYEHVDMFVEFVKNLPADEWLHFHCKKGQSRTTLFMIMYDMMHNAEKVSANDIIKRQGPLGLGGADLYGLPEKEAWDHSFKKGWKKFLKLFHWYVKANKRTGFAKSWSAWAEENNIPPLPPVVLGDYYKFTTVEDGLPQEIDEIPGTTFVINVLNETKLKLQNFRSSADLWLDTTVKFNKEGLETLQASGGNQYTQAGLTIFVDRLKDKFSNIVIVDLRHDDHLFVNGLNFSTFESKDALLNPRTPEQIKASEQTLKEKIMGMRGVVAHAIETKYPKNDFDDRYTLTVAPEKVETPEEFVTRIGAKYLLIGTKRFSEASDDDIDRFINYMKQMPADTWYHFHCKKGKSRTTFFMTMHDMLKNADKVSLEDIIERQRLIGGSDLLDITPRDPNWADEKESKKQWVVLLARFHKYASDNIATHFDKSWSQWSEENIDYQPNVDHLVYDRNQR